MRKTLILGLIGTVLCTGTVPAEILVDEPFDYPNGSSLDDIERWRNPARKKGQGMISDGALTISSKSSFYRYMNLGNSYAVTPGTSYETVPELWFRFRISIPNPEKKNANFRIGFHSSSIGFETAKFATTVLNLRPPADGTIAVKMVLEEVVPSRINQSYKPDYNNELVDVYGCLENEEGLHKLSIWFNQTPNNPPDRMAVAEQPDYSKLPIDTIILNGWGSIDGVTVDHVTVGTAAEDVLPGEKQKDEKEDAPIILG